MMPEFLQKAVLAIIGLTSGIGVSSGVFAFITMIGVVTRLAARTKTVKHVMLYEDMVVLGGTAGNLIALFGEQLFSWLAAPGIRTILIPVFGLACGIFVGCLSMALAEVSKVLPVFTKRMKLICGMPWIVTSFAFGKAAGALLWAMKG